MRKATAILPFLIGGCQQGTPGSLPDAQAVVDSLIAAQLIVIDVEQESLALASGIPFSALKPEISPTNTLLSESTLPNETLSAPEPQTIALPPGPKLTPGLSHIRYTGRPQAQPSLVKKGGQQQPLETALAAIVPAGWNIVISEKIQRSFKETLSWQAGDQWPHTLNKLAGVHGLDITLYWASTQVIVQLAGEKTEQGDTPLTARKPLFAGSPAGASPVLPGDATPQADRSEKLAPLQDRASSPTPVSPPAQTWRADTGSTLKDALFAWAASADCASKPGQKWTIAWVTETNYRIDAPLEFRGGWREALNQIFQLYQRAAVPLYAGTNTAQCVLKVDDSPMQ